MDAGPDKVRRRFTAGVRTFSVALPPLTTSQVATFDTFFDVTVAGGAISFDWVNPRTQAAAAKVRFVGLPTYQALAGDSYSGKSNMEILP